MLLSSRSQKIIEGTILALLILTVYLFTTNPVTKQYAIHSMVAILVLLGIVNLAASWFGKTSAKKFTEGRTYKILIFALITAILLWVGTTGWFLSPFFYLLYLLAISMGFLFSTSVSFSFILVLVGVLLPNIGTVNSQFDFVSLLALFLMVPLSYFLRKEYLKRVEKEKRILILEQEHKNYAGTVEKLLSNKVTKVAVDLREPLNDIKQLALFMQEHAKGAKNEYFAKIVAASEKGLQRLKTFEEETTGKHLVANPRE